MINGKRIKFYIKDVLGNWVPMDNEHPLTLHLPEPFDTQDELIQAVKEYTNTKGVKFTMSFKKREAKLNPGQEN